MNNDVERHKEIKDILHRLMTVQDVLSPVFYDEDKLKPNLRQAMLEVALNMTNYFNDIFINIEIDDIWLVGSLAGYLYNDLSDIDIFVNVRLKDKTLTPFEFEEEFKYLAMGMKSNHMDFKILGRDIDCGIVCRTPNQYVDGIYSILYNKWIQPPIKRQFDFTEDELFERAQKISNSIDELMQSMPKDDCDAVSYENSNIAKIYGADFIRQAMQHKFKRPNHEYDIDYMAYRYIKKIGVIKQLMQYSSQSMQSNFNQGKIIDK